MCFPHHQLVLRWNDTAHGPTNGIGAKGHGFESQEYLCKGGIVGRTTIWLLTTTLKTCSSGVMLNVRKDLNVSSSSPIGYNSQSDIYLIIW